MPTYNGNGNNNFYQGGPQVDTIRGFGGDDELHGGGNNDRLEGGDGADWLYGDDGADRLFGDQGDDHLNGGAGNDQINGGGGNDWAEFSGGGAVNVNLASQSATGQGVDTLSSIENVLGSSFADVLIGNNSANILAGNGGSDTLTGGGGADTFVLAPMTSGNITITDFQNGVDHIDLRALGFDQNGQSPDWGGLLSNVPGQSDAILEFYGVNGEFFTVTLQGVPYWTIDPSDYIF
ncbi:M10 family metallopeptidase C-terminal domain-containing protein [Terricaulis sp.]|uniref:M10 family metallopeptidase C-terminal domain-containing protein n=1 Tax=Terricaulis sp. TaxID=2768686 RepID=UPI0037833CCB